MHGTMNIKFSVNMFANFFDRSNTTTALLYVLLHIYVNDSLFPCFSPVFHSCVFLCKRKPYIVPLMFP